MRVVGVILALATAVLLGPAAGAAPADPPVDTRLPEVVRTKQNVFMIPFRLPETREADAAARRVVLQVSTDLGSTWNPAGEVAPAVGSFTFRAERDGEYWFRIRAIDAKGRSRGGSGPDMRVVVDAAGPRLAARVWKGGDGEIVCRYAATDDSLRLDSLKVEYRSKEEPGWKPIAAEGILCREVPAHMIGEDIWWAGEKAESVVVRISIADASGNQTVRQFTLEPSDPRVDQASLARELGVPPLPTREVAVDPSAGPAPPPTALSAAPPSPTPPGGWAPEPASGWASDRPTGSVAPSGQTTTGSVNRFVSRDPVTASGSHAETWASAAASGGQSVQYRGRPLQVSRSRRFAWDYDFERDRADDRPVRVELWSTRDSGASWQRTAIDTDGTSPIDVSLPAAGLYGFRLEILPAGQHSGSGPRSGDAPETWVAIDDEPPQVDVGDAGSAETGVVQIRYACRDHLLAPRSVKISFSPHASGPWSTIATGLDGEGVHRWQPDRTAPPRVFVRVEATDVAGNIGQAVTPEPIALAGARVVGRLGGLRELPSEPTAPTVP